MTLTGSRKTQYRNAQERELDRFYANGVLTRQEDARAQAQAEALECPLCFRPVHPDNWNAHMVQYHQGDALPLHKVTPGRVSLSAIRVDGGTQTRAQIDEATVNDYAESMQAGTVFPAVVVFYDGATYWLADGFHRVAAATQAGLTEISAEVRQGTQRDAILHSVGANAAHGLRRTNADKRRAVERLLRDEEWGRWSDREIARRCAVSNRFVSNMRQQLSVNGSQIERKAERSGTVYTMNTEQIGVKPALPPSAPAALQDAVDTGVVGVREAVRTHEALDRLPEDLRETAAQLTQGDVDKAAALVRLYKSAGQPGTNGTFDEIMTTGGFHYGPEMREWCNFGQAGVETISKALQSVADHHRREAAQARRHEAATTPLPTGKYRCIVVDPPWPVEKIARDVRPNQGDALDYPTMTLEEIAALPVADLAYEDGCHLYLWVTQKYLPAGLQIMEAWGFRYQCAFTWVKASGMTPYSWMYNTELVLFGRRGNLDLQRQGLKLSFEAPVTRHSAKPDAFYTERVIPASPEPRLEMFARAPRTGFAVWGDEV